MLKANPSQCHVRIHHYLVYIVTKGHPQEKSNLYIARLGEITHRQKQSR